MNPYVILAIVLLLGGSHTGVYFYGVKNGKNEIIAEQKKALDKAIVKHEEVAKNDLTSAIKVETTREEKKVIFRGIKRKVEDSSGSFTATLSDTGFRLWNDANSSAVKKDSSSKPVNTVPTAPAIN